LVLYDKYPVIVGIWKFLTSGAAIDVAMTPTGISHVDELPSCVPQELRWLVGFWFDRVAAAPRPQMYRQQKAKRDRG
jgi:hypothetical protein